MTLTPNELNALFEHHRKEREYQQEMAAFAGYCAAAAVAQWFSDGLKGFDKFYTRPKPNEPPPKSRVERFRDGCRMLGLRAGQLTDEQLSAT